MEPVEEEEKASKKVRKSMEETMETEAKKSVYKEKEESIEQADNLWSTRFPEEGSVAEEKEKNIFNVSNRFINVQFYASFIYFIYDGSFIKLVHWFKSSFNILNSV